MQERAGEIGDFWVTKRRGSDQWCRTWYDAGTRQTRRTSLGTSDFQAAKLKLWEWYAKHGQVAKQEAQEASFEMVLVRYYQQHAQALASAEMARVALAYWSDFFAGATVAEVTAQRQREFVAWLQESGPKSNGYVKRILSVGKAALTRAYKEGEITSVPFVLPGSDDPPRDVTLTPDQSRALWAAAQRPHELLYLALAYGTLARPEAILGLEWSFIDMPRRLLNQNPAGRIQTKKYRPVVPVCDWLMPWLADGGSGPIVQWHGKPIASFKTAWRALRRRADLPETYVPKIIRHTVATALREADVPEAEIKGMLGHKAYGGKTEVYAKYRPNYLGRASLAITEYLNELRVICVLESKKATPER